MNGQVETPNMWYKKVGTGLDKSQLLPCKVDPCIFIGKKSICVIFVDGWLWFSKKDSDIDDLLEFFKNDGPKYNRIMKIGVSIKYYLGIKKTQCHR